MNCIQYVELLRSLARKPELCHGAHHSEEIGLLAQRGVMARLDQPVDLSGWRPKSAESGFRARACSIPNWSGQMISGYGWMMASVSSGRWKNASPQNNGTPCSPGCVSFMPASHGQCAAAYRRKS